MKSSNKIIDKQPVLYAGTSGLVLPVPNKLAFPDAFRDKSRLTYYASLFNTIEVNSSFYKVPMGKTVARWADSVPDNFRFTFKLWKGITHNKLLAFEQQDVYRFLDVIAHAGNKKGCLLVQFPASITAKYTQQVRSLLQTIRNKDGGGEWKVSVEFRDASWYERNTYDWLLQRNINIVSQDISPATPFVDSGTSWVYLRFHGPEKGYRGSYGDEYLRQRAVTIRSLMELGKTVYVYFNNTLGDPINNLRTLERFV